MDQSQQILEMLKSFSTRLDSIEGKPSTPITTPVVPVATIPAVVEIPASKPVAVLPTRSTDSPEFPLYKNVFKDGCEYWGALERVSDMDYNYVFHTDSVGTLRFTLAGGYKPAWSANQLLANIPMGTIFKAYIHSKKEVKNEGRKAFYPLFAYLMPEESMARLSGIKVPKPTYTEVVHPPQMATSAKPTTTVVDAAPVLNSLQALKTPQVVGTSQVAEEKILCTYCKPMPKAMWEKSYKLPKAVDCHQKTSKNCSNRATIVWIKRPF